MVDRLTRDDLIRLISADTVQVVDVLPDAEYRRSHIPGALSIPLKTISEETTHMLSRDKPVAVY